MNYFDAHCHVQFPMYDEDREAVIERMQQAAVGGLLVGVDYASSVAAISLAEKHDDLYASIGLHPNDVFIEEFSQEKFAALAAHPKVRAIGECGLDYYRPEAPDSAKIQQKEVFEQHIQLAVAHDLPLMIHSRPSKGSQDAYHDTIDMLTSKKREYGDTLRGDMHFFVGGVDEARAFVELGFTLSYTAVITFAREYDDVIRSVPLPSLLSETDSPYVSPAPNRGTRNEPTSVRDVIKYMAQIRGENEEIVRETVLANATRQFL